MKPEPHYYNEAQVKFNGGTGALLCNSCGVIIDYGFDHEDVKHYCSKCEDKVKAQGVSDDI